MPTNSEFESKLARAAAAAQLAFWTELAEQYPECRTAHLPIEVDELFQSTALQAARAWLGWNGQVDRDRA